MDPLHARYPFFEAAREAVEEAGVSLAALVAEDAPAVSRGRERVERALLEGVTAPEDPGAWNVRDELLSYPIARILVSLIDAPAAVEKYAAAEAATARERVVEDVAADDDLRSAPNERTDLDALLREFDLARQVTPETEGPTATTGSNGAAGPNDRGGRDPAWYRVAVGPYLALSDPEWGTEWRLVNRDLVAGAVRVEREELWALLEEAVRRRIAEGLPFEGLRDSPDGAAIADALEAEIADLRDLLSDRDEVGEIDTVVPDLFPPCMANLLAKAERGAALEPFESFALMAFLTGIGMEADEIVAFCRNSSLDAEQIRFQTEYLRDERGVQYVPPSCETLHAYGVCENEDDHWEVAPHPLVYYQKRLAAVDDKDVVDWRETEEAEGTDEAEGAEEA